MKRMALNAYENYGFERLWKWWLWKPRKMVVTLNTYEKWWWLWMPMKMVALDAYENGGSKQLWKWWWLWMLMKMVVAWNAYENDGDSECLWKWCSERLWKSWLWMPMKMMVLNAYENGGSKRLWKWWLWTPMKMMVALNAYERWLWTPMKNNSRSRTLGSKWKRNDSRL